MVKNIVEYTELSGLSHKSEGREDSFDSIYSERFIEGINSEATSVGFASNYINEIFMHFYLRVAEAASTLNSSGADAILFRQYKGVWSLHAAAARRIGLHICNLGFFYYYFLSCMLYVVSLIVVVASSLIIPALTLLKSRGRAKISSPAFSIIRSPASFDKMRFLNDSGAVAFYYDDLFQKKSSSSSMYSFGGMGERFFSLFVVPVMAVRDYFLILSESKRLLGGWYTAYVLYYFSKRIAHTANFAYHLNLIFKSGRVDKYYTGNKEDRFAILEMRLCQKYSISSVCVPHGIEYAFKTPAGLAGDIFYCTTEYARKHLSELYATDGKFVYDEEVARNMFSRGRSVEPIDEIVFFPESRDVGVNISILDYLVGMDYKISVKLHPKDNLEHYNKYAGRVVFVSDFSSSISNKICLARKSTVLVEAIYNNSIAIAILADPRDRAYVERMLPALTDSQIKKVYSFDELSCVLAEVKATVRQKNTDFSAGRV